MGCDLLLNIINAPEIGSIPYQSSIALVETRQKRGKVSIVVAPHTR